MKHRLLLSMVVVALVGCSFSWIHGCNISGLDKVELCKALYRRAQPQGMGFLHYKPGDSLSDQEAQEASKRYIDYLKGRVMKVDITGNTLETFMYNRENGESAAELVVQQLRALQGAS